MALLNRLNALLLLIILGLGCTSPRAEKQDRSNEKNGGVLVINQFQGFSTLFPPSAYESSASQLGAHVYETLVAYDPESKEIIPSLAESWEMNEEGTRYTFKLREGVYFHDDPCFEDGKGRLMEGEDVLYCLKALCENNARNRNSWLFVDTVEGAEEFYNEKKKAKNSSVTGLKLLDDYQLEISLSKPNMEFINVLAHYGSSIYPIELVDYYRESVAEKAVGTGPFLPKVLRMTEVCIMERNKNYWDTDEEGNQLPYLDGLKFGFENNAAALKNSMSKGLLHIVVNADMEEGGEQLLQFVSSPESNYTQITADDLETVYLGFLNDEGLFSDSRVRKAFGLVLDKERIANEVLGSSGGAGEYGLIPPAFRNYPYQEVHGFKLNIDSAQKLLAAAGYPEGKGFPVITLQIQNRYKDVVVAQEIQQELLEHLGVSLSITAIPREQHFQRIEERKTLLWLDNWIGDYLDPQNFLSLMLSRNTPEQDGSYLNTYRYINPSFDSIVDEAIQTNDLGKRMHLYCLADVMLMQDAAIVPIYYEKNQVIQHNSVVGFYPPNLGQMNFKRVYLNS